MAYKIIEDDLPEFMGEATRLVNEDKSREIIVSSVVAFGGAVDETLVFKTVHGKCTFDEIYGVKPSDHDGVVQGLVDGSIELEGKWK